MNPSFRPVYSSGSRSLRPPLYVQFRMRTGRPGGAAAAAPYRMRVTAMRSGSSSISVATTTSP